MTRAETSGRSQRFERLRERRENLAASPVASPYVRLENPYPPLQILSADEVAFIDASAKTLLQEVGIKVLSAEARMRYGQGGAEVDEESFQVRFSAEMIEALMKPAPSKFSMYARNPERNATMGGGVGGEASRVVFGTVSGTPFLSDLDRGRRDGDKAGLIELAKLAQYYDVIHILGTLIEPLDIPVKMRHVETVRYYMTHSDKVPFVRSQRREEIEEAVELVRLMRGIDEEQLHKEPSCYTVVNMNSPLQLDELMAQGIMVMAELGQVVIVTPFTLAGAMAPVTLAGALTQQHAEALAGMVLAQIVKAGSCVVYGGFTSNVDMRSGSPAFGTPEYTQAAIATGQLCRMYNVPFRSSNVNASNAPDAQSAYESQMSIWGAMLGGCHFLLHGAGWLEGGLVASYEKFIIDIEMLQMMARFFAKLPVDEDSVAMEAMRGVGAGGHYFGAEHTLERYDKAFYEPILSDWRNFENWTDAGAETADVRANKVWKEVVAKSPDTMIDDSQEEMMEGYVAKVAERVKMDKDDSR